MQLSLNPSFTLLLTMTVDFSRDLMVGMLRKGQTGDQLIQILDVIVTGLNDSIQEDEVEVSA